MKLRKYILALISFTAFISFQHMLAQEDPVNLVAAATPESRKAGELILNKGGNAVDAAVAVAFTLGVTEPAMSGIGGRTVMILSIPDQEPIAIGGISLSPSNVDENATREDLTDYKQVAIPSQVKILNYVWKKYGSGKLTWKELLQPAIHYAEEGYTNGISRHYVFKINQEQFKSGKYHNGELLVDNDIPAIGDLIKQPTLAKTLKRLAEYGAEDFYKGEIAKQIAEDFKMNGGWITYDDLANFPEPEEYKPLHTTYRGYDVYSFGPPGGGWQVLQALNILELNDREVLKSYSIQRDLALIEALNICHNDRLENPIKDYNNYQKEIDLKISKAYAKEIFSKAKMKKDGKPLGEIKDNGETTHFSVLDSSGMGVSVTCSLSGYFGSFTSTKDLGFFYNSYLKSLLGFGLGKSLQPNTKVPTSMSPSLVRKNGQNVLLIGTPGSKRIVSTIAQVIQLWVDSSMSITDIIKLPRLHAIRNLAYLENSNLTSTELNSIRDRGFKIAFPHYLLTKNGLNAWFGGVHAIGFKNGKWSLADDPRRDSRK